MKKKARQLLIMEIISQNEVETQNQLMELLRERGVETAQATLSRDIAELRIEKCMSESGVSRYFSGISQDELTYSEIFAQSVVSVDYAANIVVMKCHAGMANAACKVVDERKIGSVMGTIAGDDTVFILTRTENHAKALSIQLTRMMRK
ncbi:MAG: hypothetical protein J1F04_06715 [Oscillospiraceae bacterium]|nr:hypothetical protein [Oscillospiraceae bacterium]